MKQIENKNSKTSASVEDAYVLPPRSRFNKRYASALAVLAVAALVGGSWAANHFYLEPKEDAALVSKALKQLESSESGKDKVAALTKRSTSDRIALTYQALIPAPSDISDRDKADGYLAALRIAIRAGIPEAKLRYGIALRDGLTGARDSAAALKIFDEVDREMEFGVRASDPVAVYITAWMLKEGLGKQPDPQKAIELAERAVEKLDGWRLESAGYDLVQGMYTGSFIPFFDSSIVYSNGIFTGHSDPSLAAKVASRLVDQKLESGPDLGSCSCRDPDPMKSATCVSGWYERGVNVGMERYTLNYADSMLRVGEPLEKVVKMFARADRFGGPHNRYLHAVIRVMLAADDQQLISALSDMWLQVTLHTDLPDDYSLKVGAFGLDVFHAAVVNSGREFAAEGKPVPLSRVDKFLLAANVRGILMGREKWMQQQLKDQFSDRLDIVARAQSSEILRKSKIAAQAIRDGLPIDEARLGNLTPRDMVTHTNPFDVFDKHPEQSHAKKKSVDVNPSTLVPPMQKKTTGTPPVVKDPEQQDKTGYLDGQPRSALGGLSTFTVDNRRGGRDAVARIYLNGKKPAVRSMYVKHGETFKSESILPGNYVFRYRFIGSEDTFESDKDFPLTQTETETGTRYSNVTVTLFKVKDGNMSTRKVNPDDF